MNFTVSVLFVALLTKITDFNRELKQSL